MISLEEFHQNLLQSILTDTQSRGLTHSKSFFENICESLVEIAELTRNYTQAQYTKRGMEIYGYDYDDEREVLTLITQIFFQEEALQTLNLDEISTKFRQLKTFLDKCSQEIYKEMEEGFEHYSMAYQIYHYLEQDKIKKIRLLLISDGKATRNLKEIPNEHFKDIEIEHLVIDIEYLYKTYTSQNASSDFEVELKIPALKVDSFGDYESYLAVMDAKTLVEIYDKYGQRLLERNIRTFLQFRGNVNRGLKNTIEYEPHKFFAYNNGITAVASGVEIDSQGNIIKIQNFQIVNGGQTSSAIYAAYKNAKSDISSVYVQMKLSIVLDEKDQDSFVAKVAEYANTQNKVNKSDFFSNSPFHKEFKDYSKRVYAPAIGGVQRRTHWFYERVRGEYLNEQAYLTQAEKKKFQLENPKSQVIDKTFLAKSEMVWLQKPHIVSKGAQDSFSEFAKEITNQLEKDALHITEMYFKEAVAKIIIFKALEKLVSNAKWYDGGYRAQIVAYTLSYLSYHLNKNNQYLNFLLIWENQCVDEKFLEALDIIAQNVYENIMNPPDGNANVGQWCKKELCWKSIKDKDFILHISDDLLMDNDDKRKILRDSKKEKRLDSSIEIESFVIRLEKEKWLNLLEHYKKNNFLDLSQMQVDILEKFVNGMLPLPSPKQCKVLYDMHTKAIDENIIL